MKKILLSGFEAFPGVVSNPTIKVVNKLASAVGEYSLFTVILPVSYQRAFEVLKKEIDQIKPDFVISLGVATDRKEISLERIAINMNDANIPDNDDILKRGEVIDSLGEDGIFSNVDLNNLLKKMKEKNIKSHISCTAGTYVCNNLMYKTLQYGKIKKYKSGFIHIPQIENFDLLTSDLDFILSNL